MQQFYWIKTARRSIRDREAEVSRPLDRITYI